MNVEAIFQNAEITSESVTGEFNRVVILRDEYDFLISEAGAVNLYKGYGDDLVEMDYHSEFIPLIEKVRNKE
ncbi:hypothetical protein [Sporosarcina obsidiansis]|uniref:hypothetical protein n=1 Tax=Sporosarcina obsidiansis TaxID=2660748 RepID=UPI00129A3B58|nr:hypothetical protein [Sporosarcina obsidiansis]